jgi:hypothetical protein
MKINGEHLYCADAPWVDLESGACRAGRLGMLKSDLSAIAKRGQSTAIAQMFGLVLPGTILAAHLFRGLKRPLFTDGNMKADADKLIYSRKPSFDCVWSGTPHDGVISRVDPPQGCVLAVFVSPNMRHRESYPQIDGWINYWTWIDEDQALPEAPIEWIGRYDKRLWTRSPQ